MTRVLVLAKAPVVGQVKTRLGAEVGMDAAAHLAAAALLDTLATCRAAFGAPNCVLALAGDLREAVRGDHVTAALHGWQVLPQRGTTFVERLVAAHAEVPNGGPVVQVGTDTPQITATDLHDAAAALDDADAVLGPAEDGGWWVLGLQDGHAAGALRGVRMSRPTTYDETRVALVEAGCAVATTTSLRDVDTIDDAKAVAAEAPDSEFARTWRLVGSRRR